ncbi:uncharacterized protein L201_003190 [Kwoniella dendrophila CBS 6074]|uniref:BZIP domain-containing protein n=1 Tax=Kwoniella dendrophila CBS 6074 TaxID=1295534 RepID=A0AAX4JTY6_9TREE
MTIITIMVTSFGNTKIDKSKVTMTLPPSTHNTEKDHSSWSQNENKIDKYQRDKDEHSQAEAKSQSIPESSVAVFRNEKSLINYPSILFGIRLNRKPSEIRQDNQTKQRYRKMITEQIHSKTQKINLKIRRMKYLLADRRDSIKVDNRTHKMNNSIKIIRYWFNDTLKVTQITFKIF